MRLLSCFLCLFSLSLYALIDDGAISTFKSEVETVNMQIPPHLYKIISKEGWLASQKMECLQLSSMDDAFIHLSTEEQLNRIVAKFWSKTPSFVILKIDTAQLPGKMTFESNPGGQEKYYHLYNGAIPLNAVIESSAEEY